VNALSLYYDLKERRVILEAQGEYLKVDAPAGVVTEEDKSALVEFKPVLLEFLSRPEGSPRGPKRKSAVRWAGPGLVRIRDPFTGEWHEWPAAKCLPGFVAEADSNRKGDRWK
jgi:TubC N-terminal docking domain